MSLTREIKDFLDNQLRYWPDARKLYDALSEVRHRDIYSGSFPVRLQYNPARAISANSKVDSASIARRPCFLCKGNRPCEQRFRNDFDGLETLVNPFPIFPYHYTLASKEHIHQDSVNLRLMGNIALCLSGMVIFYNGSKAGASAPDHLHFQAGNVDFLPVCEILETAPGDLMKVGEGFSAYYPQELPIEAIHFISREVSGEMCRWFDTLLPEDDETGLPDKGKRNILMWTGADKMLHTLFIPRQAHRPDCYFKSEDNGRLVVSPGAVDMAGVVILPREADYNNITGADLREIFRQVSFSFRESENFRNLMLL